MTSFTDASLDQFLSDDDGKPVVMLNLLRFQPEGGRQRYLQYIAAVGSLLERHGAQIVFAGDGGTALAAETGQAWDAVALVRYPHRTAFAAMIAEPEYRAADSLRISALLEAVLQPIQSMFE